MSHARIESSVPRHPKFLRAGPAASWLWLAGVCYCQEALTDGFISTEAIHALGVSKPLPLAAVLVRERLWHAEQDGWRIHDYLQHNNSAEYITSVRQTRKASGRKGGLAKPPLIKAVNQLDKQVALDVLEQIPESLLKQPLRSSNNVNGSGTAITVIGTKEQQERAAAPSCESGSETATERIERLNTAIQQHRRRRSGETDDGKPAAKVITALARDVLRQHPDQADDLELRNILKDACAKANLRYDATAVGEAMDRARAQIGRAG